MSTPKPWSVKGIPPQTRELAKAIAHGEGLTLGAWLSQRIAECAEGAPNQSTDGAAPHLQDGDRRAGVVTLLDALGESLARLESRDQDRIETLTDAIGTLQIRLDRLAEKIEPARAPTPESATAPARDDADQLDPLDPRDPALWSQTAVAWTDEAWADEAWTGNTGAEAAPAEDAQAEDAQTEDARAEKTLTEAPRPETPEVAAPMTTLGAIPLPPLEDATPPRRDAPTDETESTDLWSALGAAALSLDALENDYAAPVRPVARPAPTTAPSGARAADAAVTMSALKSHLERFEKKRPDDAQPRPPEALSQTADAETPAPLAEDPTEPEAAEPAPAFAAPRAVDADLGATEDLLASHTLDETALDAEFVDEERALAAAERQTEAEAAPLDRAVGDDAGWTMIHPTETASPTAQTAETQAAEVQTLEIEAPKTRAPETRPPEAQTSTASLESLVRTPEAQTAPGGAPVDPGGAPIAPGAPVRADAEDDLEALERRLDEELAQTLRALDGAPPKPPQDTAEPPLSATVAPPKSAQPAPAAGPEREESASPDDGIAALRAAARRALGDHDGENARAENTGAENTGAKDLSSRQNAADALLLGPGDPFDLDPADDVEGGRAPALSVVLSFLAGAAFALGATLVLVYRDLL